MSLPPSGPRKRAVALEYRRGRDTAPRVTASGRGPIAEQIVAVALERGVPVHEDAPLAEMLGKLDIDSPIPAEAFVTVAAILSYVYKLERREGGEARDKG